MTRIWIDSCVGTISDATVLVDVKYPGGQQCAVELAIMPEIITRGGDWEPGVVFDDRLYGLPQFYGMPEDVGETIAFLINDGQMTSGTIENAGITWAVRNPEILRAYEIITD